MAMFNAFARLRYFPEEGAGGLVDRVISAIAQMQPVDSRWRPLEAIIATLRCCMKSAIWRGCNWITTPAVGRFAISSWVSSKSLFQDLLYEFLLTSPVFEVHSEVGLELAP
jgi:hypothetical protein